MDTEHTKQNVHPMGELLKNNSSENFADLPQQMLCDTYGGTVHVEWDPQTPLTPLGQLVFFIQFLKTCDLFQSWANDCPLHYTSPNASKKTDILGTLLLAVLVFKLTCIKYFPVVSILNLSFARTPPVTS